MTEYLSIRNKVLDLSNAIKIALINVARLQNEYEGVTIASDISDTRTAYAIFSRFCSTNA